MPEELIDRTPSAYNYQLIIKQLLRTPLIYSPHQEIVYRDLKRYDYVTLNKRIGQLSNALQAQGVRPGDTIGVMDWDSHRYLECFFAIPMMGAILHMVNIRLSPEQIAYTINHAEDDVILVHSDFLSVLEGIRGELRTVKKIIVMSDTLPAPDTSLETVGEYETLLGNSPAEFEFADFDENTKATTFYTTGTTGAPKGVYFSHRQLVLHTLGVLTALGSFKSQASFDSTDVYMPLTPMFHVHAWGLPYAATLIGAKQVYPGRYEPETILKLVATEKVTFSHCVPTILHMLLNSPSAQTVDLSKWTLIIGGSALSRALCRRALEKGINVFTGYGMSETCPILTLGKLKPHMFDWEPDVQITVRCRTGAPIPLVDLQVADPQGKSLPHDGVSTGEVVVRSPWLTQGYFKEPEKSEDLWVDGWLHTSDIGYIDSEGYLQVTDRIKDVIKTGGEWISSLELEDILTQHEAVSEAAVIAVPDEKWGERPLALVVLKEDYRGKVTDDDIRKFFMGYVAKGVISKWGVPDKTVFVDSLAKTSVGKLNKRAMREQYVGRSH
ncbi:fatty acid--CoA ligase [Desulfoferrobacter suflitae]|uniref:fatty acid--CoA ligase n=1 Tax=Desulfoferrobacter suflitae TaxID=2865782 RepID=UPI00216418EA|nr:fatty acid--CoA ligase [Desulfoferrobacter suflitae]MCK8600887.1 fatty acid--CoA ligase [Desulfoferrobacter suflitae]